MAILAVLIGLFATVLLVGSIVLFVFGTHLLGTAGFGFSGSTLIDAVVLVILAIIFYVVAAGLWDRQLWALVLSIIVVGFLWLSDIVTGQLLSLGSLVLVLLLVYFILVRHHFR